MNAGGRLIDLSTPIVMGILNVTPDSFYDGGQFEKVDIIRRHVERMVTEGATIIDVGGYSTRPGADDVPETEELRRIIPVIKQIRQDHPDTYISIDTFRSAVAREAVSAGAHIVNDISGGEMDPGMFETVAALSVPYVLMHMRGTPKTMTKLTSYDNLIKDITDYFQVRISRLHAIGVKDIIIDPGFGFAKTIDQNFELLSHLDYFQCLGQPILVGISRKSMIWKSLGETPEASLNGTTAMHATALTKGATILRAHDVREAVECIKLNERLTNDYKRTMPL